MDKIKVGIVGATGYAGVELVRLIVNHPYAELTAISSVSFEGKKISDVYPNLRSVCDMTLENQDELISKCDVVFASLPHGLTEKLAKECIAKGVKVIDLGADFRLDDEAEFKKWYGNNFECPELHAESVYCIPELHRGKVQGASIVANPGCYPTSVALGLAPIIIAKLDCDNSIIIDSKSGVTGAGRNSTDTTHYINCNEAFSPYKIASHRHTPEIEQTISKLVGVKKNVTFTPHLLPINRGIISTIYVGLNKNMTVDELYAIYVEFYKNEKFVRVQPLGDVANLKNVRMSNYCDISVHVDTHTNRAIIVSAIDNMVKGAAGQAIQNMNIMFKVEESSGLDYIPAAF